jgi:hypothetical protein
MLCGYSMTNVPIFGAVSINSLSRPSQLESDHPHISFASLQAPLFPNLNAPA